MKPLIGFLFLVLNVVSESKEPYKTVPQLQRQSSFERSFSATTSNRSTYTDEEARILELYSHNPNFRLDDFVKRKKEYIEFYREKTKSSTSSNK
jgi:hypothetical protein